MICECGKQCLNEREARTIINAAKKFAHFNHHKKIPKRFYYCDLCGYYHTTSKNLDRGYLGKSHEK